jgi:hypothetical protein
MASTSSGARAKAEPASKAATAAVVTAGGALAACAACCAAPIALPALALGGAGVVLTVLGGVYRALTLAGMVVVVAAWAWVLLASRRSGRRPARRTTQGLALATVLAGLAALWPFAEPVVLRLIRHVSG